MFQILVGPKMIWKRIVQYMKGSDTVYKKD